MDAFDAYSHAIVSVALFALLVLFLNVYSGYRKGLAKLPAGGTPKEDYADPLYRAHRAYVNAVETLAAFTAVVAAAVLVGAAPFWVNLFASAAFVLRVATAYIHIAGLGAENGGPRSMLFALAWLLMILIAAMAVWAGLT